VKIKLVFEGLMLSGLLLIDKPAGVTSFEVVRRARRAVLIRKIGHLGTLDPFATGLLPLCLQEGTKLVPYLMPEPKTYRAQVRLGVTTDTQDSTGLVVAVSEAMPTPEEVYRAAAGFVGEVTQVPPAYSALHCRGERAYRRARRGEVVDLAPRTVTVYELTVDSVELPEVSLTVRCSQGTYMRTLAQDLGDALGCGAHLAALRRLAVGGTGAPDHAALGLPAGAAPGGGGAGGGPPAAPGPAGGASGGCGPGRRASTGPRRHRIGGRGPHPEPDVPRGAGPGAGVFEQLAVSN
jgi:tRNA pseudouridine55 synthase